MVSCLNINAFNKKVPLIKTAALIDHIYVFTVWNK